jgi:S1-C subfamily serine protease
MKKCGVLRNCFCALVCLACISFSSADEVVTGMQREKVTSILGSPKGFTKYGKTEIIYFYRGKVELESGKVIKANILTEEEAKERDYVEKAEKMVMSKFRPKVKYKAFQVSQGGALCSVSTGLQYEHFFLASPLGEASLMGEGELRSDDLYWSGNYNYVTVKNEPCTVNMYCLDKASAIKHVRAKFNFYDTPPSSVTNEVKNVVPSNEISMIEILTGCGSGFLITKDGYILTNYHVVKDADRIEIKTASKVLAAKLIAQDPDNDIALLKVSGDYDFVRFSSKKIVTLGQTVFTVGFPMPSIQGFSPKVTKGVVSSLNGMRDDVRMCQIDASIQPGNSGGPLADENGDVLGVVSMKIDEAALLLAKGTIAQNVNYALKKSYVLAFLDNHPDVATEIQNSATPKSTFEYAVEKMQKAAVMVLVYKKIY